MYLDRNLGLLLLSLSEITLLFDSSLYLDRTLAERKAKSKVKVTQYDDVWVVSSPLMFLSNGYNDTSNIGTHRNIETALANSTLYRHIYKDFLHFSYDFITAV